MLNIRNYVKFVGYLFSSLYVKIWVKGDWDFRISDLTKKPDGTDI